MAPRSAPPDTNKTPGTAPARRERLAAELRANLARRKAQARARAERGPDNRPSDTEKD